MISGWRNCQVTEAISAAAPTQMPMLDRRSGEAFTTLAFQARRCLLQPRSETKRRVTSRGHTTLAPSRSCPQPANQFPIGESAALLLHREAPLSEHPAPPRRFGGA